MPRVPTNQVYSTLYDNFMDTITKVGLMEKL